VYGDPWDDPTADAVLEKLDREADATKRAVWEWNLDHMTPKERDEWAWSQNFDKRAVPTGASGMHHRMASRHRGRNSRSASAQGKRSSRSQPKASR
jgi:hypothetical protein